MKFTVISKEKFCIIGKEGSTNMGEGFIHLLWNATNSHLREVQGLAKKDIDGNFVGCWGAMSNFSMDYKPWEDHYTKGMYLAGIECPDNALAPYGWTKWVVPGFQFLKVECEDKNTYSNGLQYLSKHGLKLQGAVQYYIDTHNGKSYMCFPIKRL